MNIIEIQPLSNGAHRNQNGCNFCPEGWVIIPDGTETPNFPFGTFDVETIGEVPTMKNWVAGTMPEPGPVPTEPDPLTQTQLVIAELAETESAHDLETKLALAELAEMIGGTNG